MWRRLWLDWQLKAASGQLSEYPHRVPRWGQNCIQWPHQSLPREPEHATLCSHMPTALVVPGHKSNRLSLSSNMAVRHAGTRSPVKLATQVVPASHSCTCLLMSAGNWRHSSFCLYIFAWFKSQSFPQGLHPQCFLVAWIQSADSDFITVYQLLRHICFPSYSLSH